VRLVELGPLSDPTLVAHEIGSILSVRESPDQPLTTALIRALAGRRVLLVLDNCEHLLQACAVLLNALLRGCPELHVLATSRESMGIDGEVAWRVPSLAVPDPERAASLSDLGQNPSVHLFVERARSVQPHFALTERTAPAVAQICQRLDGMPLALELAAARVQALTVEQLAQRLDLRFRLLTGGSRAALPRQQTLQATLDWSYDLLSRSERRLFERLAVFDGGWTLEAAETVCVGVGVAADDVLDLLARLVRKSLVVATEAADGSERYRLPETVRDYARQKLLARGTGETIAARERHATFYLDLAQRWYPTSVHLIWGTGAESLAQLRDRTEEVHDNLRASLGWWLEARRAAEGLGLAVSLVGFWGREGTRKPIVGCGGCSSSRTVRHMLGVRKKLQLGPFHPHYARTRWPFSECLRHGRATMPHRVPFLRRRPSSLASWTTQRSLRRCSQSSRGKERRSEERAQERLAAGRGSPLTRMRCILRTSIESASPHGQRRFYRFGTRDSDRRTASERRANSEPNQRHDRKPGKDVSDAAIQRGHGLDRHHGDEVQPTGCAVTYRE
jgi:predicted ATPase